MFNIPDAYKLDYQVNLKDFIPKVLKSKDKNRIKKAIKNVKLEYQIIGEEIPSLNDGIYHCEAIQFYDMEVENIKEANYLANIYQDIIKPLCIIHIYDAKDEIYSFAIKRLSQVNHNEIVIEQSPLTDKYMIGIPDSARQRLLNYLNYNLLKNKTDKVQLYKEWYYKAYMVINEKEYSHTQRLLESDFWYDSSKTSRICQKYLQLIADRNRLNKAVTNMERMKINKEIKIQIQELDNEEI